MLLPDCQRCPSVLETVVRQSVLGSVPRQDSNLWTAILDHGATGGDSTSIPYSARRFVAAPTADKCRQQPSSRSAYCTLSHGRPGRTCPRRPPSKGPSVAPGADSARSASCPSGRFQAHYLGPDGRRHLAPGHVRQPVGRGSVAGRCPDRHIPRPVATASACATGGRVRQLRGHVAGDPAVDTPHARRVSQDSGWAPCPRIRRGTAGRHHPTDGAGLVCAAGGDDRPDPACPRLRAVAVDPEHGSGRRHHRGQPVPGPGCGPDQAG